MASVSSAETHIVSHRRPSELGYRVTAKIKIRQNVSLFSEYVRLTVQRFCPFV